MSKYIIKNCPACRQYQVGVYTCDDLYDCDLQRCQDRTDCVLKQIVEKCKNTQFLSTKNRQDLYAVQVFANDLLQLLDIQEIE